jgi:hypothetical protein
MLRWCAGFTIQFKDGVQILNLKPSLIKWAYFKFFIWVLLLLRSLWCESKEWMLLLIQPSKKRTLEQVKVSWHQGFHCKINKLMLSVLICQGSDNTLLCKVALAISFDFLKWLQRPSSQWPSAYLYRCTWCYSTYSVQIILWRLLPIRTCNGLLVLWGTC